MKEFGTWYFDLARRWDGSYPHQGPPENEEDSFRGLGCHGHLPAGLRDAAEEDSADRGWQDPSSRAWTRRLRNL